MMRRTTLLLLATVTICGGTTLWANTLTLAGDTGVGLQLTGATALAANGAAAIVKGSVTLTPTETITPGLTCTFYVDETVKLISARPRPELVVDTTTLADGIHAVRLEVAEGTRLALSTGQLALHVANDAVIPLVQQQAPGDPPFVKLFRKQLLREIVWFNNREADLEKHGWMRGGRVNITLTDLMRHIGGTIIWGPSGSYITASRGGVTVRVIPGSARVYVNGEARSLGQPATRIENRTYVPIRPMLALFGLEQTHWNRLEHRAYISTR